MRLVRLLAALPFLALAWTYGRIMWRPPASAGTPVAPVRGRILAGDGSVLAEAAGRGRAYPQGSLAGQLVGFKGADAGLEGIEFFQEPALAAGRDVRLTLDPGVQAAAEGGLERAVLENDAEAGSAVALEVGTNRVLAVANYPRFDPGRWVEYGPAGYANRAFRNLFEPGSVVKALVAAALVNEGEVTPETTVETPMWRLVSRHRVNDTVPHPPVLDLTRVLRYSSNVGISTLSERHLGPDRLHHYLAAFGFGEPAGLLGASAARSRLRDWREWRPTDQAAASFGQGLSTTTLGLATAFSVIVDDGLWRAPVLVEDGPRPAPRRVVSSYAAHATRRMLRAVAEEGLPGTLGLPGYCLAGKTGTAQVAVRGRYSGDVYESVFAGFFPCEAPSVVLAVEVYGAKRRYQGSQVAAPAFRAIAAEVLAQRGVAPRRASVPAPATVRRP